MTDCYDWDKNILHFINKNNNEFNLQLRGKATIIDGESGTGKSLLVSRLQEFIDDPNEGALDYNTDNILIVNKYNRDMIFNAVGKLIIIDRGERLITDKIVDFVNSNRGKNRFLIFMRKAVGFSISPNYHGRLVRNGNQISIQYIFNVPGWF